jgi:hypothetical protein
LPPHRWPTSRSEFGRKGKRPALRIELDRDDRNVAEALAEIEALDSVKALVRPACSFSARCRALADVLEMRVP